MSLPASLPELNSGHFCECALAERLFSSKVILAGSSAGAGLAAGLSQACRDKNIPIWGVILHVPMVCDYRHLPEAECPNPTSYVRCSTDVFLNSGEMKAIWDNAIPTADSNAPSTLASPLLGNLAGLPQHLVFVTGQDPLRDEGMVYAGNLAENKVA